MSIPDELAKEVEGVAKKLGISPAELYRRALEGFLKEHREQAITDALNEVYADEASEFDSVLARMQFASVKREE